jgi:hypothetical protein
MSKGTPPATLGFEVSSAISPTAVGSAPAGVSGALATSASRSLERLPEHLLRAMATGLYANADDLAPGALFRGRDSGGCAVGITLRQLAPDAFQFGRVEFWLWHRWRRGVEPDVARRFPQLQQLQLVFDKAVREVEQARLDEAPAKAVGLWLAASAEAELRARRGRARESAPRIRWSPSRGYEGLRGQLRAAIREHQGASMDTSPCS